MVIETSNKRLLQLLLVTGLGILIWSGIFPRAQLTWLMEVLPVIVGGIILLATYRRFPLSNLAYILIWVHAIILMVGGHWTYTEMPLFDFFKDAFGLQRNYYDRLGHIAQGFIPAILAREILIRTSPLRPGKWLSVIVVAICLAVSAAYELLEWLAAIVMREGADKFLATQGDQWDTQWDMFLALCGAITALLVLRRLHDRSMSKLLTVRVSVGKEV